MINGIAINGYLTRRVPVLVVEGAFSAKMPESVGVTYIDCELGFSRAVFITDMRGPDTSKALANALAEIDRAKSRAKLREAMSYAMPECADFVRQMEDVFGEVRILSACENGIEISAEVA